MKPSPRNRTFLLAGLVVVAACASASAPVDAAEPDSWSALRDGTIVLLRHATAPGIGDPPNFTLGDCTTQRNLDATGRAEATRIGTAFRSHGVRVGAVWSSQWCRTHETAERAFPGLAQDEPVFNSFFNDASNDPAQTAAARALLRTWKGPGTLVVVSHQVNITALTGVFPGAGEGVVVAQDGDALKVIGRIAPTR